MKGGGALMSTSPPRGAVNQDGRCLVLCIHALAFQKLLRKNKRISLNVGQKLWKWRGVTPPPAGVCTLMRVTGPLRRIKTALYEPSASMAARFISPVFRVAAAGEIKVFPERVFVWKLLLHVRRTPVTARCRCVSDTVRLIYRGR